MLQTVGVDLSIGNNDLIYVFWNNNILTVVYTKALSTRTRILFCLSPSPLFCVQVFHKKMKACVCSPNSDYICVNQRKKGIFHFEKTIIQALESEFRLSILVTCHHIYCQVKRSQRIYWRPDILNYIRKLTIIIWDWLASTVIENWMIFDRPVSV